MNSKWKFTLESLNDYVIGSDKKIYKKPFTRNKRSYGWHEVKIQSPKRYRLNGEWWSTKQLKQHIILDSNPIVIFEEQPETPW